MQGIGVVNLVHSDGQEHYPIDYRIYDNSTDGKTKNDHFRKILINTLADKGVQAKTVIRQRVGLLAEPKAGACSSGSFIPP